MSLHQLRCFLTVYELGSLTAAAEELGYAQPSVSQQIRALEGEVVHNINVELRAPGEDRVLSISVVPFLYLCLRYYMNTIVARSERVKELESGLIARLYEVFNAIRLVQSFARERRILGPADDSTTNKMVDAVP